MALAYIGCKWSGLCEEESFRYYVFDLSANIWLWPYFGLRMILYVASYFRWKFKKDEGYYLAMCWPMVIWFAPWIISKLETERKLRQVQDVMGS